MAWRKNMTPEQRRRYNASKRKQYAKKRKKAGLSYTPRASDWAPTEEELNAWAIEDYFKRIGCL